MFIVRLKYKVPLERIDELLPLHVEWLHLHETAGRFVVYGRLVPRTGGVIVVDVPSRAELDAVIATDPFALNGASDYEVMEFMENKCFAEVKRPAIARALAE